MIHNGYNRANGIKMNQWNVYLKPTVRVKIRDRLDRNAVTW